MRPSTHLRRYLCIRFLNKPMHPLTESTAAFWQRYEFGPESIRPFCIHREPVARPRDAYMTTDERKPYCACLNRLYLIKFVQLKVKRYVCRLWERRSDNKRTGWGGLFQRKSVADFDLGACFICNGVIVSLEGKLEKEQHESFSYWLENCLFHFFPFRVRTNNVTFVKMIPTKTVCFSLVLWHINHCRLSNAKSIFIHINSSISNNSA